MFNNKVISIEETVYKVAFLYLQAKETIFVVDELQNFVGGVGIKELEKAFFNPDISLKEIVNYECKTISKTDDWRDEYNLAAAFFARNNRIQSIPVLKDGKIFDILTRDRVFFEDYLNKKKHKRPHYAENLWNSAIEAKKLGIKRIAAIEFGVAGGNGLVMLENYAN